MASDTTPTTVPKIYLIKDNLTDPIYCSPFICIVSSTNAITCKNFGITKMLADCYPYCNVAGRRYIDDESGIALEQYRGREGNLKMTRPREGLKKPSIATLITQYGIGLPFEENMVAQSCCRMTFDSDHANRLMKDTTSNRLQCFEDCMLKLVCELGKEEYNELLLVLIPMGIGRGGQLDAIWMKFYLPMIRELSMKISKNGKRVCLVMSEEYRNTVLRSRGGKEILNTINKIPVINRDDVTNVLAFAEPADKDLLKMFLDITAGK